MNIHYKIGAKVRHATHGRGTVGGLLGEDRLRVAFPSGPRVVFKSEVSPDLGPRWADVMPGDTAEFEAHGDRLKIKARGNYGQATVLGWKTTELDGVWDLLSIKKQNPAVPTRFGAKVVYRDKTWVLMYSAMVLGTGPQGISSKMIWVEINEHAFNWVGHMDIDREEFRVSFTGWNVT